MSAASRARGPWRAPRIVLCAVLTLAALPACRPAPLAHTYDSPEALAQAVVDAVARRDLPTLRALPLTEEEFRRHVWPDLPVSRPERNVPFDYVWQDLRTKSAAHLTVRLSSAPDLAGSRVARVLFDGDTTAYAGFRVRRKARVLVQDASGQERSLRLFGSILEKDGRYKLFSYVTD